MKGDGLLITLVFGWILWRFARRHGTLGDRAFGTSWRRFDWRRRD
jgi:hypothetical protein